MYLVFCRRFSLRKSTIAAVSLTCRIWNFSEKVLEVLDENVVRNSLPLSYATFSKIYNKLKDFALYWKPFIDTFVIKLLENGTDWFYLHIVGVLTCNHKIAFNIQKVIV